MKNFHEKFKTSLTNFLLILILIFLGIVMNLLSNINENLGHIHSVTSSIDNSTYAALYEMERNNLNKNWNEDEYKQVNTYISNFWKFYKTRGTYDR